jgi:hypothetical protein
MDSLTDSFEALGITEKTSRSKARRNKEQTEYHQCTVCFKRFHTDKILTSHLKKVHKAVSKDVKDEFKTAKLELAAKPNDEICVFNFKLANLKVTCLEKYA